MKLQSLINHLENIAPLDYQESYDNSGLIVGNPSAEISGVMICLDSTEAVLDEAIAKNCNVIIAHHPIVFGGLKKITGRNYVERVVIKAIKNDLNIYACHTNLDNISGGVNQKIADKLGLKNTKILSPKQVLSKTTAYFHPSLADQLRNALLEIGVEYKGLSFSQSFISVGAGSNTEGSVPAMKMEFTHENSLLRQVKSTLDRYKSEGTLYSFEHTQSTEKHASIGSGMIGKLKKEMTSSAFFKHLKKSMNVSCIKHTALTNDTIKKVAVCGGSGGFLLKTAIQQKADIFITADYKYHEFFDADNQIIIADIGHYESEQFTSELFSELISEKFSNFAVHLTTVNTNPVQYFF